MKKPLHCLLAAVVTGVACIMPAGHARAADAIYVACALDGTIRQYATSGISGPVRFFHLSNP